MLEVHLLLRWHNTIGVILIHSSSWMPIHLNLSLEFHLMYIESTHVGSQAEYLMQSQKQHEIPLGRS